MKEDRGMMKGCDRIVIFEYAGLGFIFFAIYFILRKYKVMYFEESAVIRDARFFKALLDKGIIRKISRDDLSLSAHYEAQNLALDGMEEMYGDNFGHNRLTALMENMFKSPLIHSVYKKDLLIKLHDFYDTQLILNEIARRYDPRLEISFIPAEYIFMERLARSCRNDARLSKRISIPRWSRLTGFVSNLMLKIAFVGYLVILPAWVLCNIRKIVSGYGGPKKKYKFVIRLYNGDFGFVNKYRSMDFLLDGNEINSDNVLFCAETGISKKDTEVIEKRKYAMVTVPGILKAVSADFIREKLLKKFLPYWRRALFLSLAEPWQIVKITGAALRDYLTWSRFLDEYSIRHFIAYNDFERQHIIRNILLSHEGVTTWQYIHSSSTPDLFTPPGGRTYRHVFSAYLYYDKLVCWSDSIRKYQSSFQTHIGSYENFGCLWSELAMKAARDVSLLSDLRKKIAKNNDISSKRIIGVFDTNFGGQTPLKFSDGVGFIDGIIKFLDDHRDTIIIFKEKLTRKTLLKYLPEIAPVYDRLYAHPRCYGAERNNLESAEVIAVSDLIISGCYTAPTVEALGAGKKAIYFDAAGSSKGCGYDAIPKLVAHGYGELKELARYWLYDVDDKGFEDYLRAHIKGELDAYVDGKAITRFRQALAGSL